MQFWNFLSLRVFRVERSPSHNLEKLGCVIWLYWLAKLIFVVAQKACMVIRKGSISTSILLDLWTTCSCTGRIVWPFIWPGTCSSLYTGYLWAVVNIFDSCAKGTEENDVLKGHLPRFYGKSLGHRTVEAKVFCMEPWYAYGLCISNAALYVSIGRIRNLWCNVMSILCHKMLMASISLVPFCKFTPWRSHHCCICLYQISISLLVLSEPVTVRAFF